MAQRRLWTFSQEALSAIANGVDYDAGEYAKRAMHEARYMEWIKAKLLGRPFLAYESARPATSWTDPTRNRGAYE